MASEVLAQTMHRKPCRRVSPKTENSYSKPILKSRKTLENRKILGIAD